MSSKTKTIKVDYLARVEGEGAMSVKIKGNQVEDVKLKIFEPPRFFEAFLRGRAWTEAPDITARICGICPVAYQMSAVHAMEDAVGVKIEGTLRELRRLLYCGEWIESHTLHIYMLHAPDFLGYPDAISMAKDHSEVVNQGLKLKKAGNDIVRILAGREIHPINVKLGGFYRLPTAEEFAPLIETLKRAREMAINTVLWSAKLPFPDFNKDYTFVSLSHPEEYPLNEGRIVSNRGLNITSKEYEDHFQEEHVEHSNALHSILLGTGSYFVGPMARYALNYEKLSDLAKEKAREAGLGTVCTNPFQSIIVRSVEILYAVEEALRILESYVRPTQPCLELVPHASEGFSVTEAPRGILYHKYQIDAQGEILNAKIVPPTSQNQKAIEEDLFGFVQKNLSLSDEKLRLACEQAIRNYDPCISCATHFLDLKVDRGEV
jgi:sulfhydrogenase subunit alpha